MYADSAYYTGEFLGAAIPAEQLDLALEYASDLVDVVTLGRVADYGFASLTAFQQAKIKRACCILAEDVFASGALTSGGAITGSFSIGDLSIQEAKDTSKIDGIPVRKLAISLLRQTGLTYTGVG